MKNFKCETCGHTEPHDSRKYSHEEILYAHLLASRRCRLKVIYWPHVKWWAEKIHKVLYYFSIAATGVVLYLISKKIGSEWAAYCAPVVYVLFLAVSDLYKDRE